MCFIILPLCILLSSVASGYSDYCNQFNLLASAIFYSTVSNDPYGNVYPLIDLVDQYKSKYGADAFKQLNADAYVASFAAINNQSMTGGYSTGALDFCGANCSILVLNSGDVANQAVSNYYYQLANGSCSDLFITENWYYLDNLFEYFLLPD